MCLWISTISVHSKQVLLHMFSRLSPCSPRTDVTKIWIEKILSDIFSWILKATVIKLLIVDLVIVSVLFNPRANFHTRESSLFQRSHVTRQIVWIFLSVSLFQYPSSFFDDKEYQHNINEHEGYDFFFKPLSSIMLQYTNSIKNLVRNFALSRLRSYYWAVLGIYISEMYRKIFRLF